MAAGLHAMLTRHPWLVQAFGPQVLPGTRKARCNDHSLAIYEAAGFTAAQADQAAPAVFTYVLGNALGPAAAAYAAAPTAASNPASRPSSTAWRPSSPAVAGQPARTRQQPRYGQEPPGSQGLALRREQPPRESRGDNRLICAPPPASRRPSCPPRILCDREPADWVLPLAVRDRSSDVCGARAPVWALLSTKACSDSQAPERALVA